MASILGGIAAMLGLSGSDDEERWQDRPNRTELRRAGRHTPHTGPVAIPYTARRRVRPEPHEVFPLSAMTSRTAVKDGQLAVRLDRAYDRLQTANAKLDEHERTPWVFPWQEQDDRDMRARRRRGRQARRAAQAHARRRR